MLGQRRLDPPALGDVIAGISVALVLIPQSMAYAELAGLPPYIGLFAGALPPLLAAPFTSSPYLQTGPVALTSLLTFGALEGRAELASANYVELAALLALIVGGSRLILGIARLGIVAYLMSEPVLIGFTSAAAVLIVSSQLPTIFGVVPEAEGVIERAWWTLVHPDEWHGGALVFSAVTLVLMLGGRRLHPLFPGVLIAVIGTAIVSSVLDYSGATLGDLPGGFIEIDLGLPWGSFGDLLLPGIVIALVGFAEPASISRTFAAADRIPWSSNKELVSQGVANLAAGVSGAFPVGGSFSRSSLNRFAGATSVWSGAITGAVVLAFLPLSPILEPLPRAVLGAIVFGAVFKLIQLAPIYRLWSVSIPQAIVATGTFVATIATSPTVERGVLIGLGLSIVMHLFHELAVHADHEVSDELITIRPRGVIWFASAPRLEEVIAEALRDHPDVDQVCVDLGGVGRVDYTGAMVLKRFVADNTSGGIRTHIINIAPEARSMLQKTLGDNEALPALPEKKE
jgi:SulP family sulfate permease